MAVRIGCLILAYADKTRTLSQYIEAGRAMQSRFECSSNAVGHRVSDHAILFHCHELLTKRARTRVPIGLDVGHHQCMQWDKINDWMKERSVDVFQPGLVVHPILGKRTLDF